jgi:hypothetical protein
VLSTKTEIIRTLVSLGDFLGPNTASLVLLKNARKYGNDIEPFRKGFLNTLDERLELIRRLNLLERRKRVLLLAWYLEKRPVTEISKRMKISRTHCYRLRNEAIQEIIEIGKESYYEKAPFHSLNFQAKAS